MERLVQTLCKQGHLHQALHILSHHCGTHLSDATYLCLLKACNTIPRTRSRGNHGHGNSTVAQELTHRIYAHIQNHRSKPSFNGSPLGDYLVMSLARCGSMESALGIFGSLSERSVFSWTAIITAYSDSCTKSDNALALRMYDCMVMDNVWPNGFTFVALFRACTCLRDLMHGQTFHVQAHEQGLVSDNAFVCNALITMYGKCGAIIEAEKIFYISMVPTQRDIVSWTAMLSAYVDDDLVEEALHLYMHMMEENCSAKPDRAMLSMALVACRMLAEKSMTTIHSSSKGKMCLEIGRALHSHAHQEGFSSDPFVQTNLVSMYAECGSILDAESVFLVLTQRDPVAWTAMLAAYVWQCEGHKALQLYERIRIEKASLDDVMLMYILQACSDRRDLTACNAAHFDIVCGGYDDNPSIASTLVHTYGHCSSIADARDVFRRHPKPDIIAWNTFISGHIEEGNISSSLELFKDLSRTSIQPDGVTFVLIISACRRAGLLGEAVEYLQSMRSRYNLVPEVKHYNIIIDLLGRTGDFKGIDSILGSMPMRADVIIWWCVLCACRVHGNFGLAKQAFKHAMKLEPHRSFAHVMMSKIYAESGLHEFAPEVEQFRLERINLNEEENVPKRCSTVCVESDVYSLPYLV